MTYIGTWKLFSDTDGVCDCTLIVTSRYAIKLTLLVYLVVEKAVCGMTTEMTFFTFSFGFTV